MLFRAAPCHVAFAECSSRQNRRDRVQRPPVSVKKTFCHLCLPLCTWLPTAGLPESPSLPGPRDGAQGTVTKLLPNPLGRKISEWAPTRLSSPVRKKRRMTGLRGDFPFKIFRAFSSSVRPPKHSPLPHPPNVAELSGDVSPLLGLPNCPQNLVSRGRSAFGAGRNGGRRSEGYVLRIETCRCRLALPPNSPKPPCRPFFF